jgi:D-apiose dehydrogenase
MAGRTRIGVIGAGFFAQFHLKAWRDLAGEGAELVAVCDIDAARAGRAAEALGIRAYTDAAEMLAKENLGLADIATRMDTHLALVRLTIGARVPTIVQKPLAPTWAEAVAIVETAAMAGVFLAVHENFRFQAPMLAAKRLIDEGAIGAPSWACIAFRTDPGVYRNQPYFYDEERLVILDVGIHMLDLARFFFGEAERVSCETQRRNPKVRAEDTATMLLRHTSGAVTVAECTYENQRLPASGVETLIEIEGPEGAIVIDRAFRLTLTSKGKVETRDAGPLPLAWAEPGLHVIQDSVVATCRHLLAAVREGRDADISGPDNLKTYALVEAAYRAATEHRAVAPESWPGVLR